MKPQRFVPHYQIAVMTALLAFLVGCGSSLISTSMPAAVPTSTLLPILTLSPTAVPSAPTPSPVPPTAIPSPTDTSLPTPAPAPTLTADERQAFVAEMLKTNGGCELPCWWGITPGKTDWETLKNRFTMYGGSVFDVSNPNRLLDYHVTHSFSQQNGVVQSIQIMGQTFKRAKSERFAQDWHRYSLEQVLTRFGVPSQVQVSLIPATEPGALMQYGLTVAYDDLGFYIHYEGPTVEVKSKSRACPVLEQVTFIVLQLQVPQVDVSVLQPINPEDKPFVHTLEEATGMNLDTFYKTFKSANSQACLDLPTTWP